MKNPLLATPLAKAIALALPLSLLGGCSNNDSSSSNHEVPTNGPVVSFNLEEGQIPYPNDLTTLKNNSTLQSPNLASYQATVSNEFPNAFWNYLSSQDGWGTSMPVTIPFDNTEAPATLNATTLKAGVKVFRQVSGELQPLAWGEDFQAKVIGDSKLSIEPLKPLAERSHYILALTDNIKDQRGASIQLSDNYKQLLESETAAGKHLQSIYQLLDKQLDLDQVAYVADFTTTSNMALLDAVVDQYLARVNPAFEEIKELDNNAIKKLYHDYVNGSGKSSSIEQQVRDEYIGKIKEHLGFNGDNNQETSEPELNFRVLETTLTLPYYLDTPTRANCKEHPKLLKREDYQIRNQSLVAPEEKCEAAFSYWQDEQGMPLSTENASHLKKFSNQSLETLIILPNEPPKEEGKGYPTVIYIHGVTSQKESILTAADEITSKGYALIAIDQPMHNSRKVEIKYGILKKLSLNATGNLLDFVMPSNVLTTKGYMYQALVDNLGLRMAISNGLNDPDNHQPLLDRDNVHLMGISLGGIVATSEAALLNSAKERHPEKQKQLTINTASLAVPGASVASITLHSPALQGQTTRYIKETAAFRLYFAEKQGLYQPQASDTNKERIEALNLLSQREEELYNDKPTKLELLVEAYKTSDRENDQKLLNALNVLINFKSLVEEELSDVQAYEALQQEAWKSFAEEGEYIIQSVLDPVDPVNHARTLANDPNFPVLLMEVVGDGSNKLSPIKFVGAVKQPDILQNHPELTTWNPGDFVVPNAIENRPQGGTEPLIRALGLDIIDSSQTGDGTALRAAVRYSYGNHGSLLKPTDLSHISTDLLPYDKDVHESMIESVLSFMDNQGQSINLPSETTDGKSILEPANTFPAKPE